MDHRGSLGPRRSQAEEAMAAPACACHRLGDLRQAAIGLAIPGEALIEDHHTLEPAIPLSGEESPGLQLGPIRVVAIRASKGCKSDDPSLRPFGWRRTRSVSLSSPPNAAVMTPYALPFSVLRARQRAQCMIRTFALRSRARGRPMPNSFSRRPGFITALGRPRGGFDGSQWGLFRPRRLGGPLWPRKRLRPRRRQDAPGHAPSRSGGRFHLETRSSALRLQQCGVVPRA